MIQGKHLSDITVGSIWRSGIFTKTGRKFYRLVITNIRDSRIELRYIDGDLEGTRTTALKSSFLDRYTIPCENGEEHLVSLKFNLFSLLGMGESEKINELLVELEI